MGEAESFTRDGQVERVGEALRAKFGITAREARTQLKQLGRRVSN